MCVRFLNLVPPSVLSEPRSLCVSVKETEDAFLITRKGKLNCIFPDLDDIGKPVKLFSGPS